MAKANIKLADRLFPQEPGDTYVDTVNRSYDHQETESFRSRRHILQDALRAWENMHDLRKMEQRNKMYTFGDQWGDTIEVGGAFVTERDYIKSQGNVPLTNNRIRGIVRTINGIFQSNQTEPVCVARDREEQGQGELMSNTLQYVYQNNKLWGLDSHELVQLLLSGAPVFRSEWGYRESRMDVWTDIVPLKMFFVDNNMEDPRHSDCHLVGRLYDWGLDDVLAKFAHNGKDAAAIRYIYSYARSDWHIGNAIQTFTENYDRGIDFFRPEDSTRCRVIEVWRKEAKERLLCHDTLTGDYVKYDVEDEDRIREINRNRKIKYIEQGIEEKSMRFINYRWIVDRYWYCYFLSPFGDVLYEGETPYWHESHPFSFKLYPYYDKKVYPFVNDLIDQQRYINRYTTLLDFVIRNSAKGVLAIPIEAIEESFMTKEQIAKEWTRVDGVIYYTAKELPNGQLPQQITNSSVPVGLMDAIALATKSLEEISLVSNALQGMAPKSGTPAALFAQQTQNSATTLTELFEAFRELRESRDMKNLQLIQQYYTEPRQININGTSITSKQITYDPAKVRDVKFDLNITESTSTPSFRYVINETLMQLFSAGAINVEMLLENGAFPFSDKLLQSLRKAKEDAEKAQSQMEQGGDLTVAPNIPSDVAQDVYSQAENPYIKQLLNTKAA